MITEYVGELTVKVKIVRVVVQVRYCKIEVQFNSSFEFLTADSPVNVGWPLVIWYMRCWELKTDLVSVMGGVLEYSYVKENLEIVWTNILRKD